MCIQVRQYFKPISFSLAYISRKSSYNLYYTNSFSFTRLSRFNLLDKF
nr:MAG TPA: hypothetical protein [Caudoviricetes sp.]